MKLSNVINARSISQSTSTSASGSKTGQSTVSSAIAAAVVIDSSAELTQTLTKSPSTAGIVITFEMSPALIVSGPQESSVLISISTIESISEIRLSTKTVMTPPTVVHVKPVEIIGMNWGSSQSIVLGVVDAENLNSSSEISFACHSMNHSLSSSIARSIMYVSSASSSYSVVDFIPSTTRTISKIAPVSVPGFPNVTLAPPISQSVST